MSKHDESRRDFLVRAAVGAGAVAGAGLVPDAVAQKKVPHPEAQRVIRDTPSTSHSRGGHQSAAGLLAGHGAFLNHDQVATIAAFTERLMPGAPGKPGATDANVVNYIDLALAGAYADLQDFYRRGLASLDAYCRKTYSEPFVRLSTAKQDGTIAALAEGIATGFTFPTAQAFFNTLRTHTIEGMFADPIYGGNKDFAGWRLVGFPGPQAIYTSGDMKSKEAFTRAGIVGLQGQNKNR